MSSRILCLPNLISKEHSLLLFKRGRFCKNLFSWVIFACCSIPSTAMLSTRRRQNWPPYLHCQYQKVSVSWKGINRESKFHHMWVRIYFQLVFGCLWIFLEECSSIHLQLGWVIFHWFLSISQVIAAFTPNHLSLPANNIIIIITILHHHHHHHQPPLLPISPRPASIFFKI